MIMICSCPGQILRTVVETDMYGQASLVVHTKTIIFSYSIPVNLLTRCSK